MPDFCISFHICTARTVQMYWRTWNQTQIVNKQLLISNYNILKLVNFQNTFMRDANILNIYFDIVHNMSRRNGINVRSVSFGRVITCRRSRNNFIGIWRRFYGVPKTNCWYVISWNTLYTNKTWKKINFT